MRAKNDPVRIKRRKRIAVWSFVFIMVASLAAPFSGFLLNAKMAPSHRKLRPKVTRAQITGVLLKVA